MDETDKNRRDEIVRAALRAFAKNGFHKASIKRIANEAGLKSPSLIYWYFKDKDELLYAVITSLAPLFAETANPEGLIDLPPEVLLPIMAKSYFDAFANPDAMAMIKIFLAEAIHSPESVMPLAQKALQILHFFTAYLARQIELGRLRQHDVQASARMFVGMLLIYMLTREILVPLSEGLPEPDRYAQEVVSLFLDGLRP